MIVPERVEPTVSFSIFSRRCNTVKSVCRLPYTLASTVDSWSSSEVPGVDTIGGADAAVAGAAEYAAAGALPVLLLGGLLGSSTNCVGNTGNSGLVFGLNIGREVIGADGATAAAVGS